MSGHFSALLSIDAPKGDRVPVTVLTGFLGSGKTTLLNRLLRQPDLQGMAVIVNEFGEIGIDHDLIAATHDDTVLLANGCLCCSVRGDLTEALLRLVERTDRPLRQVLIETSGLADPAPILRTLMADPLVCQRYALAGVVCTIDAVLGLDTLAKHAQARVQAAVADHLFFTKTDLLEAPQPSSELQVDLQSLNVLAQRHLDRASQIQALYEVVRGGQVWASRGDAGPVYRPVVGDQTPGASEPHIDGISSFVVVRDEPLPRDAFFAWLDMLIAARGADMLRVKGLVNLREQVDQPMVIHGVQHLFSPPEFLPAWPSPDRRTRLVFIVRGVERTTLDDTLDVLVRRHLRRDRGSVLPAPPEL